MTVISSHGNPHFKALRLLSHSGRERRRQRAIVLDGPHLVQSGLDHGSAPSIVAVSADAIERPEIARLLKRCSSAKHLVFAPALFAQLAPVDHPVGILAVAAPPEPAPFAGPGRCAVLLEGVQDPGNVGAIVRTAAAAGVDEVLLSAGCADPWAPRTLRAGMGAQFVVGLRPGMDLETALEGFAGAVVATVARGGRPPHACDLRGPTAFLLGGEGAGLSDALLERSSVQVTIPMSRGIESLNVGAAAAVLLFERVRQLSAAVSV